MSSQQPDRDDTANLVAIVALALVALTAVAGTIALAWVGATIPESVTTLGAAGLGALATYATRKLTPSS